jgi:polyisoprenoid-binding protein YceI
MKALPVLFGSSATICVLTCFAAPIDLRIDPDHTFVHFAVLHTGVSSVWGRMASSRGTARLDPEQQTAEVSVELDPRSIDTGVKKLDAALVGEQFFDVGKFKTARFTGQSTKFADGVPVEFTGELTLHGVTKPVQLIAQHFVCKQVKILVLDRYVCGGDLQTTLKRSDFGVDRYSSLVSDEVRVVISVEAIREGK